MGELAKIESFRKQLAIIETIEEIKLIGNATEAYQNLMIKQKAAKESIDEIGEFDIEVKEKEAEWLNEFYPHGVRSDRRVTKTETLKDMPVTPKESAMVRNLKKAKEKNPEKVKETIEKIKKSKKPLNAKTLFNEIKKEEHKEDIEKQKESIANTEFRVNGLYDIIAIDPPWNYGRGYDPEGSRVANPYPEMTFDELGEIKIPAEENCILWLWTTHAFIWDAKRLLGRWGFEYKAILVWDKEIMGMGNWLRMQCEFCLLGIKGKPIWDVHDIRDILRESRREHSRKPEAFYKMIDDNFPGKKLDYFSREERPGWIPFGNDTNKF